MYELRLAHTGELTEAELAAIRELLWDSFDDMTDEDYEHALGGMHAMAFDGDELIGHASLVMRRLLHGKRALRAGYVEGVAVRAGRRRQGVGAMVMTPLERLIRGGYDIGALGATDDAVPFYLSRGWALWPGTASVLAPRGHVRTPDEEGWIYVRPVTVSLDPDGDLACDWRGGDVW